MNGKVGNEEKMQKKCIENQEMLLLKSCCFSPYNAIFKSGTLKNYYTLVGTIN